MRRSSSSRTGCTSLFAHAQGRLTDSRVCSRTIIDFDKILLLDKGKLIEFDSPAKLLEDPTSRFYALCRATGRKEFAILKKMSKGKARVTHRPRKVRSPRALLLMRSLHLCGTDFVPLRDSSCVGRPPRSRRYRARTPRRDLAGQA